MRQLRQMLRLAGDGMSSREIAQRLGIARSTLAAVEYLDRPGCRADIDLLADEPVGHGIEELFELDVIIGGDAGQAPFGELVILRRQAGQGRLFHGPNR